MGNGESINHDDENATEDLGSKCRGADSSQSDEDEPEPQRHLSSATGRRVLQKIRAVAIFQRSRRKTVVAQASKVGLSRGDLYEFVKQQRKDKLQSVTEIDRDAEVDPMKSEKFRVRPTTPKLDDELHIIVPTAAGESVHITREKVGICPLCSRATVDGFPCRVCGQVFHKACLDSSAHVSAAELDRQLRTAYTNLGWSCPTCDDLSALLTEEELVGMIEDFERFDLNKDSGIVLHEYLDAKQRLHYQQYNEPIGDLDLCRLRAQFQCMDIDADGVIAWWEFVKHEAGKRLAKRSKEDLVKLLSPMEIAAAQQHFNAFDDDRDGRISEFEVKRAYRSWYGRLSGQFTAGRPRPQRSAPLQELGGQDVSNDNDAALTLHVQHHSQMVLGDTEMNHGVITWEDFIKDQALYLLTSRPNRSVFPKVH